MTSERMLEREEENVQKLHETRLTLIRGKVPQAGRPGPEFCGDCESEIPLTRRQLGYERCVHCVEKEERYGKR